jgi:hypothetical protein
MLANKKSSDSGSGSGSSGSSGSRSDSCGSNNGGSSDNGDNAQPGSSNGDTKDLISDNGSGDNTKPWDINGISHDETHKGQSIIPEDCPSPTYHPVIHCPPAFFVKHGVCNKDIFIDIHKRSHISNSGKGSSGSYNLSSGHFDAIKIARLGKDH